MNTRPEASLGGLSAHSAAPHSCSADTRYEVLSALPLLKDLPQSEIAELHAQTRAPGYRAEETIYQAGQRAEHLFVVATGTVKLTRTAVSGQSIVTEVLGPGESFGAMADLDTYPDSAIAMRPSCVLTVSMTLIRRLMERYPQLSMTSLDQLSRRYEQSRQLISRLSADSVEARIAAALLELIDKLGERRGDGVVVSVTQQDLASMVGTTPESVSRTLGRLRAQGIVATGRGHTEILDAQRLEALAV